MDKNRKNELLSELKESTRDFDKKYGGDPWSSGISRMWRDAIERKVLAEPNSEYAKSYLALQETFSKIALYGLPDRGEDTSEKVLNLETKIDSKKSNT